MITVQVELVPDHRLTRAKLHAGFVQAARLLMSKKPQWWLVVSTGPIERDEEGNACVTVTWYIQDRTGRDSEAHAEQKFRPLLASTLHHLLD